MSSAFSIGNTYQVTTEINDQFQLDPNELYNYPSPDLIVPLKTCALTSEVKKLESQWTSGDQYIFETSLGASTQFISNCMKVSFTIPLTVKLKTAVTDAAGITEGNFMEKVFADNADICYSQYSILQGITNMNIDLNGASLINVSNILETFNMVAPYYAGDAVDKWFHSSQPDRFQDFEDYQTAGSKSRVFFNDAGRKTYTSNSVVNEANIFNSTYQEGYASRTPQWEWVSAETDNKTCHVKASFHCYLPLTFGSVPSQMTALSGINKLKVQFNMRNDLGSYLFNIIKAGKTDTAPGDYRYESITVNASQYTKSDAAMYVHVFSPPQFMRESMIDHSTGLMQPYNISYPRISTNLGASYAANAGTVVSFNQSDFTTNSVPRAIYVGLMKKKHGGFEKCSTTPINFGLLQNLTIKIDSAVTTFNDQQALSLLVDENGYDQVDSLGKLLKGYPIKIDVSSNLSLPGDMIVGQSGIFRIAVEGSFLNQSKLDADYQLIVVVVNDAMLQFDGHGFALSSGIQVDSKILDDKHFLKTQYDLYGKKVNVMGGGFFGDAAKWLKKNAVNVAKSAWKNRAQIAKTVGDVGNLVKAVQGGQNISGGRLMGNNISGGNTQVLGAGSTRKTIFK